MEKKTEERKKITEKKLREIMGTTTEGTALVNWTFSWLDQPTDKSDFVNDEIIDYIKFSLLILLRILAKYNFSTTPKLKKAFVVLLEYGNEDLSQIFRDCASFEGAGPFSAQGQTTGNI